MSIPRYYKKTLFYGIFMTIVVAAIVATGKDTYAVRLNSALIKSVYEQNYAEVESLLKKGANPNAIQVSHCLSDKSPIEELIAKIQRRPVWHELCGPRIQPVICIDAAMSRYSTLQTTDQTPRIAELLLNWGADVNARNDLGRTALMEASDNSDVALVKLLIKRGANVNGGAGGVIAALTLARYHFESYQSRRSDPQYRKADGNKYKDTSAIYFMLKAAGAKE